jgi:beta-glucosidase
MLPYENAELGITERTNDLLRRMTLEEKLAQLSGIIMVNQVSNLPVRVDEQGVIHKDDDFAQSTAAGIGAICYMQVQMGVRDSVRLINAVQRDLLENTRLGIPAFIVDEGAHGHLAWESTIFPLPVGMAATFNPDLVERVFDAVGREIRVRGGNIALTPVGDIGADPRWGRVEETFGEDTHLVTRMMLAAVAGLQGGRSGVSADHIAATAKHFAGFGQSAGGRQIAPADLPERVLRDQILPVFKAAVMEAGVSCVMPAYIEHDGIPAHAHSMLLRRILREEWGFQGLVVSDFGGVPDLFTRYRVVASLPEAARRALHAGVDMDLPEGKAFRTLEEADTALLAQIDASVQRVLALKFSLGLFENPYADEARALEVVHSASHQQIALEAAEQSLVLLKNQGALLPLEINRTRRIALIGPHSRLLKFGGYSGHGVGVSIYDGLLDYVQGRAELLWSQGCLLTTDQEDLLPEVSPGDTLLRDLPESMPNLFSLDSEQAQIDEAAALAATCDVAIVCLGESYAITSESNTPQHYGDRESLELVGNQLALLRAVKATGVPTVVILIHGRTLAIAPVLELADAMIDAWNPGEARGIAIARAVFGDINPGGKLPFTVPFSAGQLPLSRKITGYEQLYAFQTRRECLPFGYGLSYTTFTCSTPRLEGTFQVGDPVIVLVEVTNTGTRAGDEVVQVYVTDVICSVSRPRHILKAFQRVSLMPGETQTVALTLEPEVFNFTDEHYQPCIEPGDFEISVGTSSQHTKTITLTLT